MLDGALLVVFCALNLTPGPIATTTRLSRQTGRAFLFSKSRASNLMSALLNPPAIRRTLTIQLDGGLAAADSLLDSLRLSGATVHHWSLASGEDPSQTRLTLDVTGDTHLLEATATQFDAVPPEQATCFELALVTVSADGDAQDEAAAIIADAGGRLVAFNPHSLTAQISNRPEKIEAMLQGLRLTARVEVVRSGPLVLRRYP